MVIKRENKIFVVYGKELKEQPLFRSHNFEECVNWVNNNGAFHAARKKIKEIVKKA